jgi:hypothetical protein
MTTKIPAELAMPTHRRCCVQSCCYAGTPDALRSILKHAEAHLAAMVHAAWDLTLITPSKKPSVSLNDAIDTPEQKRIPERPQHDSTSAMESHVPHDLYSDTDSSSSDWYADHTSSDGASQCGDDEGRVEHGAVDNGSDEAEDVSENAALVESGTSWQPCP